MSTQTAGTSVQSTIVVDAPIERAFTVFTEGMQGPDRTRVELEHRILDRHGDGWEQMRDAVGSPDGWGLGLRSFMAQVAK
ncbi:MAG: hypothetical protein ACR2KK_18840 [Acidimicrobiales bacterium]